MAENKTAQVAYTFLIIALVLFFFYISKAVLMPFIISIFLAFLLRPSVAWLQRHRIPLVLSALISIGIIMLIVLVFSYFLSISIGNFTAQLPVFSAQLQGVASNVLNVLQGYGIDVRSKEIMQMLNLPGLTSYLGKGMLSLVSVLSNFVLIFFMTLFLLLEGERFEQKSVRAYGEKNNLIDSFGKIGSQIQRYIFLKTIVSFVTGVLVYLLLFSIGVKFALLWGILTFLLNYIPTVGSIIATVPPVLIALLQFSPLATLAILASLTGIQTIIGNYIEPRLLGRELNLSPLVVFLNMIIWGLLWGPAGMILATPLLVGIKVVVSYSDNFKKIMSLLEN